MFDPRAGAKSLIQEAIGARSGQSIAIIAENPGLGIYDAMVPLCVADVAADLGMTTKIIPVGDHAGIDEIPGEVAEALENFDHVLFHARLGDTLRFSDIPGGAKKTMSYALDLSVLGGASCTVPHRIMEAIRAAYNKEADKAEQWHITCPLGTDISGSQDVAQISRGEAEDFTVTRYPVCAPRPIACNTANGVVALKGWLMASGNRKYDDDELLLPDVVLAEVKQGRITDLFGPSELVDRFRVHYIRVGETFGMDPWSVHSWHAGINPGCRYPVRAQVDLERWGKVAFANPRYLHFHTCGNYAPGEIAWSLFDTDVFLDGRQFWDKGHFCFLDGPEVTEILKAEGHPKLAVFSDIGVD